MNARSSAGTCARSFEAEAVRDGRIVGDARASFLRHAETCTVCGRADAALAALATLARAPDDGPRDELHARRERLRLLAAFERSLISAPVATPSRRPAIMGACALVATVAIAILGASSLRGPAAVATPASAERAPPGAASAEIEPSDAPVWSRQLDAKRETITLAAGTLAIRVTHARPRPRLVVQLPDGELEDIGTTFTVHVEGGRTTRVAVSEGSVVLRLRGQAPRAIDAGDAWESDAAPSAVASADAPVFAPTLAPPVASSPRAAPASRSTPREAPDDRSRAAQAEDAAYLHILALQRAGDEQGTKAAARAYLARFPAGFRRVEVEGLSR